MINFNINEIFEKEIPSDLLEKSAVLVLLDLSKEENVEITIAIDDDEQLRRLNLQFLGIDAPTDVLSFPADETDPDSGNHYLGDIIISYPRAVQQAQAAGHPIVNELQLLVIHGVLHLLGYDHVTQDLKNAMWSLQARFLNELQVEIKKLPED